MLLFYLLNNLQFVNLPQSITNQLINTMKQIKLISILTENFKYFNNTVFPIPQDKNEVTFIGDNGTGKTSIREAFEWVLGIYTGTVKNIHSDKKAKTVVEIELLIDGRLFVLKKTQKPVWENKKGEEIETHTGNENEYFFNGEKKMKKDFEYFVSQMICDISILKLIVSPNSIKDLAQKDLREQLFKLEKWRMKIEDERLHNDVKAIGIIKFLEGKSKTINAVKKEISEIPVRYSEIENFKPKETYDYEKLNWEFLELDNQFQKLEEKIEVKDDGLNDKLIRAKAEKEHIEKALEQKKKETFDTKNNKCSACGQELTDSKKIELLKAFEAGKELTINSHVSKIQVLEKTILTTQAKIDKLNKNSKDVQELDKLKIKIAEVKEKLATETNYNEYKKRLSFIENRQKELASALLVLEKDFETVNSAFNLACNELEERINTHFQTVKIKLFERQLNGVMKDVCILTVDGVNFDNLNTAKQVNSCIEVINAISLFNQIEAPLFVDNRESIVKLAETKSQVINFVVDKNVKTIQIIN